MRNRQNRQYGDRATLGTISPEVDPDTESWPDENLELSWALLFGFNGIIISFRGIVARPLGGSVRKYLRRAVSFLRHKPNAPEQQRFRVNFNGNRLWHLVPRHGYSPWEPNYSHWLLESLPMLDGTYVSGDEVIVNRNPKPWQVSSLMAMGVKKGDIKTNEALFTLCRTLIVGRFRCAGSRTFQPNQQARRNTIGKIQSTLSLGTENEGRRLFLSRQDLRNRYITNFEEVSEVLANFGIEIYIAGSQPWCEEVKLFSSCSLIIGCHGAALANSAFCKPGSTLIEISGGDQADKILFQHLCEEFELHYYKILASMVSEASGTNPWYVSPRALEEKLHRLPGN